MAKPVYLEMIRSLSDKYVISELHPDGVLWWFEYDEYNELYTKVRPLNDAELEIYNAAVRKE